MTNETKRYYREAREHGCAAHVAIFKARRFIAGPLADYRAKLEAWKAEPDKRRYAPGGIANRPKFPQLYAGDNCPLPFELREATDKPRFIEGGYYSDAIPDNAYTPRVWRLPHGLFLAGYDSTAECTFRYADKPCDDERDAWREADSMAEHDAEESREYSERWQQASAKDMERDEARADLAANRARAVGLVAVLRATQQTPESRETICGYIREHRQRMREAIETIRECTDEIHDLDMQGEF